MAETTKKLFRFFDAEGNAASIKSEDVFDKTSGKTLAEYLASAPTENSIKGQIDILERSQAAVADMDVLKLEHDRPQAPK